MDAWSILAGNIMVSTLFFVDYSWLTWNSGFFRYLKPLLDTKPGHLNKFPSLSPSNFHLHADPNETHSLIRILLELRNTLSIGSRPLVIYLRPHLAAHPALRIPMRRAPESISFRQIRSICEFGFQTLSLDGFDGRILDHLYIRLSHSGFLGGRKAQ